jgi:hypothetical protein
MDSQEIERLPDKRSGSLVWLILYTAGLALFYFKYVPLVGRFQLVLVPILTAAVLLTWRDLRQGTLYFIFAFPLINSLPYFFGISEPLPHAPAALVLFLFFFLGFLLNREKIKSTDALDPLISKSLLVFALVVALSAGITLLRYTNYFPFHGFAIYELKTNSVGTSAGGAIMSVIFQALNYLTGIAFFMILSKTLRSKRFLIQALLVLTMSTTISLGFGLFQHFGHLTWGNNPSSISNQIINGTFKDAMSFGAYLSMTAPLFLGLIFSVSSPWWKIQAVSIVLISFFLILYAGSKIGLFSFLAASAVFGGWVGIVVLHVKRRMPRKRTNKRGVAVGIIVLTGIIGGGVLFKEQIITRISDINVVVRLKFYKDSLSRRIEALWKPALRMMADYPLTGVGMGGFIIEAPNYSDAYVPPYDVPESAENYLLQVGSELGVAGLLAIFWVAWVLYREIRKGFRKQKIPRVLPRIVLSIGAATGILAFVINSQMHTYIGSYEIKYTLWFLLGLLVYQSRLPEGECPSISVSDKYLSAKEIDRAKKTKPRGWHLSVVLSLTILIFAGIHLWNSTHSLSLQSRTKVLGLIQEFGLDKVEKTADGREFRWTREYGGIPIKISKPILVVPIHAANPDIVKRPIKIQFVLVKELFQHKRFLEEITIVNNDWKNVELPVAEDLGQDAILLIKVNRTWNPQKVLGVPDPRNLGVAVGKIEFRD